MAAAGFISGTSTRESSGKSLKKEAPRAGNRWSREFLVFGCLLFLLFSENVNFPTLVGNGDYHGDNFFELSGRTIAVQVKTDKEQKIMQKGFVGSKEEMQKVKRELKNSPHWRGARAGNGVIAVIKKGEYMKTGLRLHINYTVTDKEKG